jgi:hypothetical protein
VIKKNQIIRDSKEYQEMQDLKKIKKSFNQVNQGADKQHNRSRLRSSH